MLLRGSLLAEADRVGSQAQQAVEGGLTGTLGPGQALLVVRACHCVPAELAMHAGDGRRGQRCEDLELGGDVALRGGDRLEHRQCAAVAPGGGEADPEQPARTGSLGRAAVTGRHLHGGTQRFDAGVGATVECGALTGAEQAGEIHGHASPCLLGRCGNAGALPRPR
jgi:hypothetical protein